MSLIAPGRVGTGGMTALDKLTDNTNCIMNTSSTTATITDPNHDSEVVFDVRPIPCNVKHGQIFQRCRDLAVGQFFVLLNDHDPKPLWYQLDQEFKDTFSWEYLERGPEDFRVRITKVKPIEDQPSPTAGATASQTDPNRNSEVVFDVRPIPGRVKHTQIFQRWLNLPVGEFFVLLNDHDPVPLRYQFEAEFENAFSWEYLEHGPEEFRVKITKLKALDKSATPAPSAAPVGTSAVTAVSADVQKIDVRGLEPPEPLVRILDALESLPIEVKLHAWTDREPCHLFGEAEQRGFSTDCKEQSDGSWLTVLARA